MSAKLAKEAKISHSTVSKFRNDPNNVKQLNTRTVAAIEAVGGIPPYQLAAPERPRGFAESEAEPYRTNPLASALDALISTAKGGRNGLDAWVLRSRALENAGYLVGDDCSRDFS